MKIPSVVIAAMLLVFLGCAKKESAEGTRGRGEETRESHGTTFKEGKGLEVPTATQKKLGLEIVEVAEQKLSSSIRLQVQVYYEAGEKPAKLTKPDYAYASGQIAPEKVSELQIGQDVIFQSKTPSPHQVQGRLLRFDPSIQSATGQVEVLFEIPDPKHLYPIGTILEAVLVIKKDKNAVAIPRSALLKTAEGTFVYVQNGKHFFRTAIKVGIEEKEFVEITDGLYAGDQVVQQAVLPLWLAELQAVKGGAGCAHDH